MFRNQVRRGADSIESHLIVHRMGGAQQLAARASPEFKPGLFNFYRQP